MTWYDPDEIKAMADGAQTQPEFDVSEDLDDEGIRIVNDIIEPDGTTAALVTGVNAVATIAATIRNTGATVSADE